MSSGEGVRGRILDTFAAHESQKKSKKIREYTVIDFVRRTGYDTDIVRKKRKQEGLF